MVPVFNESAVVVAVLNSLLAEFPNVVAVDDGSTDATASLISALPVHVLHHPVNLGQGAAIQTGLSYALSRGADLIATFDSDGQMDSLDLRRAFEKIRESGAEVCLGSRFGAGMVVGMPPMRKLALELAVRISRVAFAMKQSDVHNGLRIFTRLAAEKIHIRANGMAHATDIIRQIERHQLRWVESPVTIRYTPYSLKKGQRTANGFNILWDLLFG